LRQKDKENHLYHNNYILTSVHFRNEDTFLKLCKKHERISPEGDKVKLFSNFGCQGTFLSRAVDPTLSLNQLSKDLNEAANIIVIREAEPGIPAVVRKSLKTDEYGGVDLIGKEKRKISVDINPDFDSDQVGKKSMMEAKEVKYRQEKNIEELKRIGVFLHIMNIKNKTVEKNLKELEVELSSLEEKMDEMRIELKAPKVGIN
jgi:hypothetical protein